MTNAATPRKPGKVQALAIINLVSGCLNAVNALVMAFYFGVGGLMSMGIMCIGCYMPLILGASAVFEILYAMKILPTPMKTNQPSKVVAILQICCILACNPIALAAGILNLVFANDPEVKEYFANAGGGFPVDPALQPPTDAPPSV